MESKSDRNKARSILPLIFLLEHSIIFVEEIVFSTSDIVRIVCWMRYISRVVRCCSCALINLRPTDPLAITYIIRLRSLPRWVRVLQRCVLGSVHLMTVIWRAFTALWRRRQHRFAVRIPNIRWRDRLRLKSPLKVANSNLFYPARQTRNTCFREFLPGSCHKRQKPQAPTPQAPIRNRQTRRVSNAKVRIS